MLSIARRIGALLAVMLPLLLAPSAATAGPGSGGVECDPAGRPKSGCTAKAGSPGTNKGTSGQDGNGSGDHSNSGSGGDDGCTYRRTYPSAATAAALGQPSGKGGWYFKTCYGVDGDIAFEGPIWIGGGP